MLSFRAGNLIKLYIRKLVVFTRKGVWWALECLKKFHCHVPFFFFVILAYAVRLLDSVKNSKMKNESSKTQQTIIWEDKKVAQSSWAGYTILEIQSLLKKKRKRKCVFLLFSSLVPSWKPLVMQRQFITTIPADLGSLSRLHLTQKGEWMVAKSKIVSFWSK